MRLNKVVQVIADRLLPPIWSVVIASSVLVGKMGGYRSGDDPGLVTKGKFSLGRKHARWANRQYGGSAGPL
ncbi:MAG: hypothetical protein ACNA8H_07435 [Anaerolineales bacterium]